MHFLLLFISNHPPVYATPGVIGHKIAHDTIVTKMCIHTAFGRDWCNVISLLRYKRQEGNYNRRSDDDHHNVCTCVC